MSETVELVADLPEDFVAFLKSDDGGRLDQIKALPGGLYAGTKSLLFHWTLIIGAVGDEWTYITRYCYVTQDLANQALTAWDGTGEPTGWHRHPDSGRRRQDGDPSKEYIER